MTTAEFEGSLLLFINGELLRTSNVSVAAETPLFQGGIIDSLKILHLLAFIESAVGRSISDDEIVMNHFQSVRVIAETFLSPG